MLFAPDTIICGRFRLIRELGNGGMGTVWQAEQLDLRRHVAIKFLRDPQNSTAMARFEREAMVMARVDHPHAVQVYDYGQADADGVAYIAMELIEGECLADKLEREGLLSCDQSARLATQIAEVLGAAHEAGIVHRDLKPSNVMLETRAQGLFARVVDFGIASLRGELESDAPKLTKTGQIPGTAAYVSPEQCRAEPTDGRTDLYQLGCIWFEMLTGRPPFDDATSAELMAAHLYRPPEAPSIVAPGRGISGSVDDAVLQLLRKRPEQRPPNAQAVVALIQTTQDLPERGRARSPRVEGLVSSPLEWPLAHPDDGLVAVVRTGGTQTVSDCDMLLNALGASGVRVTLDGVSDPGACGAVVVIGDDPKQGLASCSHWVHHTAVLLCGGESDFDVMTQAIAHGVFDWVPLPLEPADGVRRVLRALRRRRAR